jgi:hypothetical protein
MPTNRVAGVVEVVRIALEAMAKLQNKDGAIFAFHSPRVKYQLEVG